jgi:hypothetical protein
LRELRAIVAPILSALAIESPRDNPDNGGRLNSL